MLTRNNNPIRFASEEELRAEMKYKMVLANGTEITFTNTGSKKKFQGCEKDFILLNKEE